MKGCRIARWLGALVLLVCVVVVGTAGLSSVTISSIRSPLEHFPHEGIGELVATARACQTFVAQYNGLSRVEVLLDDLGRQNRGPFHFYLRSAPDASEDIVLLTRDASAVRAGEFHAFEFPPIQNSAGQTYAFCLEAPEAPLDNAITAFGVLDDWYPEGQAVFRDMWGEAAGVQDLDFHLGYRLSLGNKLRVLSKRLAANKPFLCGNPWFYALLGVVYLALLYALFARFLSRSNDPDEGSPSP